MGIEYPELPPGFRYKKKGEHVEALGDNDDIDILYEGKPKPGFTAPLEGWASAGGVMHHVITKDNYYKEMQDNQQEALNVLVMRLYFGITE